jgi:hypothetical protein
LALLVIAILLTACDSPAVQVIPPPQPTAMPTDESTAPAVAAAKSALAERLNISMDTIQLVDA